ncbi:uncharacterized protein J7T54_003376 [Emericellopsis cladophorae]|uniref:Uncharacterized protein n=1 Tax=Emericellopsis cladophorae TaxID=2686198 RepID=A0A9Q0BAT8_9HYPO|nr:uncharacterized protein J7T54_003376 [Emericellopsis cladophorae]KAI6778597.1 hypothetical protein J7T54_003376 [Emericellopsis cladophorae]
MSSDTSTHNGNVRATAQTQASNVYSVAQRSLDRVVLASSRQAAYENASEFAHTRPILFSFVVAQLAFSFLPFLLFIAFSVSTVALALGVAVVFGLFWISVAFMVLVPTLLVTSSIAVSVWGWAIGSFLVARWLYVHSPIGVKGDMQVDAAGRKMEVVKNEKGVDGRVERKN